ncbi:hypothetical protein B0H19DRAFT_655372 [Mycena capillaripes]|nr:hypothetical protein B0H19DRAFT_655372 [Mycena capillaripes]
MSSSSSGIPVLAPSDVSHAISLIQAAYAPVPANAAEIQSLQSALLTMQRTPAAWGLILPLLAHPTDPNVQFFGAHTAHAKIARGELVSLPLEEQLALRDALVREAGVPGRARVVRRKLYGALTALAVRLVPVTGGGGSAWEGWVEGTVGALVGAGAPSAHIHEFLAGVAEDVASANMLPQPKIQLESSLRAAAPLVLQSISAVLASPPTNDADALPAALACLVSWLPNRLLPDADVARLVPPLIALLGSSPSSSTLQNNSSAEGDADAARTALSELIARPPAAWSPAVLLEPLLVWCLGAFPEFSRPSPSSSHATPDYTLPPLQAQVKDRLRKNAKLLIALAEAGVEWVAGSLVDFSVVSSASGSGYTHGSSGYREGGMAQGVGVGGGRVSRATLAQTLLRIVLALTRVDAGGARLEVQGAAQEDDDDEDGEGEDENGAGAGAPLYFWFLLQEALWEIPVANPHLFPSPSAPPFPAHASSSSSSFSSAYPYSPLTSPTLQREHEHAMRAHSSSYESSTDAMDADADLDAARTRAGGTPWTPGVVRTGSYAFSSLPPAAPAFSSGGPQEGEEDENAQGVGAGQGPADKARTAHARAAYVALVRILRGKVVCGRGWGRDRLERFAVYRRDVGDTLVNAYYILRDDLLTFLVGEAEAGLEGGAAWETIEAPLHCLRSVHEALDLDSSTSTTSNGNGEGEDAGMQALGRLFGAGVWGRLPASSSNGANKGAGEGEALAVARLRRTALGLVDTYAAYFTTRTPDALLAPLQYVLGALADADAGICLQAALALRSLCDANRRALASRIGAFAEVHAGLGGVPDSEKGKVLQSIASVIQALPPAEGIAPVEAMVGPILQRLGAALGAVGAHPEAARLAAILQLEILAGVAKGLTRTADPLAFDEEEGGGEEAEAVRAAREDPRTGAMRAALFDAISQVAELWSADAEVGQALSELFKAITALPADVTLLSLPAGPLLGVVCRAAGRRLNGVWLALAAILIAQLNPPPLILTLKSGPSEEAEASVREAVGTLVAAALGVLGAPGGMVENPDIVQEFFACMDRVAQDFTAAFCALPDGAFDALMQCAISALALQERYSLVAACTFLGTLIHRAALYAPISPEMLQQLQAHMIRTHGRAIMRAVLCGFAGAAPRSVAPNLLELLAALVSRWDERAVAEAEGEMREGRQLGSGARGWVAEVVFADDFYPSKAGQEAKERFVKTVVSSRSVKKTKEAANQFTIVAWGLEGSTFGYSSVSS